MRPVVSAKNVAPDSSTQEGEIVIILTQYQSAPV
jgi:hypothetical protein